MNDDWLDEILGAKLYHEDPRRLGTSAVVTAEGGRYISLSPATIDYFKQQILDHISEHYVSREELQGDNNG